jgi:hypothetical protein
VRLPSRKVAAPIIAASAVSRIGLNRTAPASTSIARKFRPSRRPWRMKSTSRIELRTMMPASAMKPIIEVAVNGAPSSQWPVTMPIRVSGKAGRGCENEPRTQENQIRRYHIAVVACFRGGVPFQRVCTCCDSLLQHVTASLMHSLRLGEQLTVASNTESYVLVWSHSSKQKLWIFIDRTCRHRRSV